MKKEDKPYEFICITSIIFSFLSFLIICYILTKIESYAIIPTDKKQTIDSVAYAYQIGRLDVVSVILAMFGVGLLIATISWFGHIKNSAVIEAKNSAEEWIKENPDKIENIINKWLDNNNREIFANMAKIQKSTSDDASAEEIANDASNDIEEGGS